MAKKPKGDLISDLADTLISGKGLDLSDIIDSVAENAGGNKQSVEFPVLTTSNWWTIRNRFKKNIPETITKKWIADTLDITTSAAEKSILPELKRIGLISSTGKTTDRAEAWASDSAYAQVCEKIRKDIYPASLREMETGTKTAQNKITSWFKKKTGAAETTAKRMTNFYLLLVEAVLEGSDESSSDSSGKKDTASKSSDDTWTINLRIDFPSYNAAKQFDAILTDIAGQIHSKIEKLK